MKLKHKIMLILAKSKEKRKMRKHREEEIKELIGQMARNSWSDDDRYILVFETEREAFPVVLTYVKRMPFHRNIAQSTGM